MGAIPSDLITTPATRGELRKISRVKIPEVSKFSKDITAFIDKLFDYLEAESN